MWEKLNKKLISNFYCFPTLSGTLADGKIEIMWEKLNKKLISNFYCFPTLSGTLVDGKNRDYVGKIEEKRKN